MVAGRSNVSKGRNAKKTVNVAWSPAPKKKPPSDFEQGVKAIDRAKNKGTTNKSASDLIEELKKSGDW